MKAWRPYHRGTMVIAPRLGSGQTPSGLYIEVGTGAIAEQREIRATKMIGDVEATFATRAVRPDDVVAYQYGSEHTVNDAQGESLTVISEAHILSILSA